LKLAILKGNRLNAWHLALYECAARLSPPESPLEITAFVPPDNLFETESLRTAQVQVPYEFAAGPWWRRVQARWRYRRLHQRAGYEFAPYRLEKRLEGFDLIQSWETFTPHSRAAVRAAARSGAKTLITVWDDLPHNQEHLTCKAAIKREVRAAADGFLVYTEAARDALREEGVPGERIHRVWPGVDLRRYEAAPIPPGELSPEWLGSDPLVILFAGRLVPEKGIYELLEAAQPLCQQPKNSLRLLYVGSGRERESLEEEIRRRRLSEWVRVVSRRPYSEMPAWLARADVVVLPSMPREGWREQFGMIAIEALAAGRAVIASRTPGMEEMLGDSALLVEAGDVDALSRALDSLARSPERRRQLARSGKQRAAAKFDQTKNALDLLEIYRRVLSVPKSAQAESRVESTEVAR